MLDELTDEKKIELLRRMPPIVRELMGSEELTNTVLRIIRKYDLRVDEGDIFDSEIVRVLLGATHPQDFPARLRTKLATVKEEALSKLIQEVDTEIFEPIRTALIKHAENIQLGEQTKQRATTATSGVETQPTTPQSDTEDTELAPQSAVPSFASTQQQDISDKQANDDIEKRLQEEQQTSHEKKQVSDNTENETATHDTDDPYREPIE